MKRVLIGLLGAIGVATLMMWSAGASAHKVTNVAPHTDCEGTLCYYGAICPDGWGGCYWYEWKVGSAVNTYEEKSGLANVVRLCTTESPESCVNVTSGITLVTNEGGSNAVIICRVPGGDTCTDGQCGGSPGSSGAVFLNTVFSQDATSPITSDGCTKDDKGKGGIKCSKSNTLQGLEGDAAAAAAYCPSAQWSIVKWLPLNFLGTTSASGPTSKQDPTIITTTATAHCWLKDPQGLYPYEDGYQLSSNIAENNLECVNI